MPNQEIANNHNNNIPGHRYPNILTCNNLPRIPVNDTNIWRRIRIIPFLSTFDNSNNNNNNEN